MLEYMDESRLPPILYRARNRLYSNTSLAEEANPLFTIRILDEKALGQYKIVLKPAGDLSLRRSRTKLTTYFIEDPTYLQTVFQANSTALQKLEAEAISFIKHCAKKYADMHIVCSFSGGKDSAVSAYLVKQAIGKVPLIFSDTRIEYPETVKYVKESGPFFGDLIYLQSRNDFFELCEKFGPPSRMMRWCCSTQKAGPINEYYTQFKKGLLSFDGIRRSESRLRADYPREKDNTKLIKQFSAYPIIEWNDLHVWLYILWRDLPMNKLYQEGFARIGCWGCPNNGKFDSFLLYHTHPELADSWYALLSKYWGESASNYNLDWITDGAWKMRRVHYENEDIGLNFEEEKVSFEDEDSSDAPFSMTQPCLSTNDYVISFQEDPPPVLLEFLSVFGTLNVKKLGSIEVWDIDGPLVNIKYFKKKRQLKFEVKKDKKTVQLQHNIIKQINKSFNCIACGACLGSCPTGAIYMSKDGFKIKKDKCKHCLICCTAQYLGLSCVALHYAAKRKLVYRSDIQKIPEVQYS